MGFFSSIFLITTALLINRLDHKEYIIEYYYVFATNTDDSSHMTWNCKLWTYIHFIIPLNEGCGCNNI